MIAIRQPALIVSAQKFIARSPLRAPGNGGVAVRRFVGAEILDPRFQRRILVFQGRDLRRVMLIDHFFHRGGAGKGRLLAQRGGGAPSAKPAMRHTGSSAVGRTRRSLTSLSKAFRWRCSCSAMCAMVSTLASAPFAPLQTASWPS